MKQIEEKKKEESPVEKEEDVKKKIFENRELSWLSFDERVLDLAGSSQVPLGERLSFLSIYNSNLDEFYRVRVGTLFEQSLSKKPVIDNKTGMSSEEQLSAIVKRTKLLEKKASSLYQEEKRKLEEQGIHLLNFSLLKKENAEMKKVFESQIEPFLSPFIVSNSTPFPFLDNQAIYALVVLKKKERRKLGILLCANKTFPRVVKVPGKENTYALSEELILHYAGKLFPKYEIEEKSLIRITRNADISFKELEDEDMDYLNGMEKILQKRKRLSPVRVEYSKQLSSTTLKTLSKLLDLPIAYFFRLHRPLDLRFLSSIRDLLKNDKSLFYPPYHPLEPAFFTSSTNMIDEVKKHDILLSYPYQSMRPFLKLLGDAGKDKRVVSIFMTLYRVADHSEVVKSLAEAALNGKEVIVLVELRARFDEENNIEQSRLLEESGCHVIYGLENYKVHSKLCLITLKEEDGSISYITQVGTGNYNEKTAKLYTDFCLMTKDKDFGEDAHSLFNALLKGETLSKAKKLWVAPEYLRTNILALCDEEIAKAKEGKEAYLGFKANAITDKELILKLIEASKAGVKVELLIRGISCLKPQIKGISENIRVVSVVGRYLEHGRIYRFGKGKEERIYISSADLMTRNTMKRVEVAAPVLNEEYKKYLAHYFDTLFNDNVNGRELLEDGLYHYRTGEKKINAHSLFQKEAIEASKEGKIKNKKGTEQK